MTTTSEGPAVSPGLVHAALAAARRRGTDVAEVPLTAIAEAAGISRSTLLRRLGGSRAALDEAVRAAGVDPGGRPPVRERAVTAAAELIGEQGLGAVTLDAVAAAAGCSLPSLHAVFGGRDGLLVAVFDRYSPVLDVQALAADPPERVEDTVEAIYRALVAAFGRRPRVMPALVADLLSRPDGPAARMLSENLPRLLSTVFGLLDAEVAAGRLRSMPYPLMGQLLVGPLFAHMMLREVIPGEQPSVPAACREFTAAFLRATAPDPHGT